MRSERVKLLGFDSMMPSAVSILEQVDERRSLPDDFFLMAGTLDCLGIAAWMLPH